MPDKKLTDFFPKKDSKRDLDQNDLPADGEQAKKLKVSSNESVNEVGGDACNKENIEASAKGHNYDAATIRRKLSEEGKTEVVNLIAKLSSEWIVVLKDVIKKQSFENLAKFVVAQRQSKTIYPPHDMVFSWSHMTPIDDIKVVILGQDPYHGPNQAHGLAFSVLKPTRPPPSLINIYKEIAASLDAQWPNARTPEHGDLTAWAEQGVLMLNAVLTVEQAKPNSHQDRGWEHLTDKVVDYLAKVRQNIVFMLWGASAQNRGKQINRSRHLVLSSVHPSPLSASRGFMGCKHFSKANEYLVEHGLKPIEWMKL